MPAELGARSWPIWSCGVSCFAWTYDEQETCLLLEGQVECHPRWRRTSAQALQLWLNRLRFDSTS